MEDARKRILAIALEGSSKVQAISVWDGQHLIVIELRDIKGNPEDWIEVMERDIEAMLEPMRRAGSCTVWTGASSTLATRLC